MTHGTSTCNDGDQISDILELVVVQPQRVQASAGWQVEVSERTDVTLLKSRVGHTSHLRVSSLLSSISVSRFVMRSRPFRS